MTPDVFIRVALDPALSLLPPKMDSPEARALILCICLQESGLKYRRQIGGPARGLAQFELTGIRGVLNHSASKAHIRTVLDALIYDYSPDTSYTAIENNDVLAICYARLLLYTLPDQLPEQDEPMEAFDQYIGTWRPGRPRQDTWNANYRAAWDVIA